MAVGDTDGQTMTEKLFILNACPFTLCPFLLMARRCAIYTIHVWGYVSFNCLETNSVLCTERARTRTLRRAGNSVALAATRVRSGRLLNLGMGSSTSSKENGGPRDGSRTAWQDPTQWRRIQRKYVCISMFQKFYYSNF